MRADLQSALARRKAAAVADPAEQIALLRQAVEQAELAGNLAVFRAALAGYEAAVRAHPGAETAGGRHP